MKPTFQLFNGSQVSAASGGGAGLMGGDAFDPFGVGSSSQSMAPAQQLTKPAADDLLSLSNNDLLGSLDSTTAALTAASGVQQQQNGGGGKQKKSAEEFLGGALNLVNLDSLVTRPAATKQPVNPFLAMGGNAGSGTAAPMMAQQQQPMMSLNQLRGAPMSAPQTSMTTISVMPTMTQPVMHMPPPMQPPVYMQQQQTMFPPQQQQMAFPPQANPAPFNANPWGAPPSSSANPTSANNNPFLI